MHSSNEKIENKNPCLPGPIKNDIPDCSPEDPGLSYFIIYGLLFMNKNTDAKYSEFYVCVNTHSISMFTEKNPSKRLFKVYIVMSTISVNRLEPFEYFFSFH